METAVAGLSRRERHVAETRRAIVEAAEALFAENGYGDTTIEQVAERAGIAPRTFFRYFPTKESVLFADVPDRRAALLRALRSRPPGEHPFVSLASVVRSFADDVARDTRRFELRQRIRAEYASVRDYERGVVQVEFADALAGFVAERLGVDLDADVRPRLWAALAMTTFLVAFHAWLDRGRKGSLRSVVDKAMAAAAEALAALP